MSAEILKLYEEVRADVGAAFSCLDWAQDEICAAQQRHPQAADVLWHAWEIILPGAEFPVTEFVWRGHMRELLERVAKGEDTRPGTCAEICLVCSAASARAPLNAAAAALYHSAWTRAFRDNPAYDGLADYAAHGAWSEGSSMRELERLTRRRIASFRKGRRISPDTECDGEHEGQLVVCRFTPAASKAS